jgi:hypothetical protein
VSEKCFPSCCRISSPPRPSLPTHPRDLATQ